MLGWAVRRACAVPVPGFPRRRKSPTAAKAARDFPLGSLRGGLRPRGLANGPGGAYLSTVRQGWKCSIPCKFPDSLLRVKHAEQNAEFLLMRRALPLTERNVCTRLPPSARGAGGSLSVYYALCVKL